MMLRHNPALRIALVLVALMTAAFASRTAAFAQPGNPVSELPPQVFVPDEDLGEVLDHQRAGVLLTADKYAELLRDAAAASNIHSPNPRYVIRSADYAARVEGSQLLIDAKLSIRSFARGWQIVPLPFRSVFVETISLDGKPAAVGRTADDNRTLQLFIQGLGDKQLALTFVAPLMAAGSDQLAGFGIPSVGSAVFKLPAPAGRQLQVGDAFVQPVAADGADVFQVPVGGTEQVILRLTDERRERQQPTLIFANTVIGAQVSPEEAVWRAVVAVQIYGRPVDTLEFTVPKSLDLTKIDSTGLERWEFVPGEGESTKVRLVYRQAFAEPRAITLAGLQATPAGQSWNVATLQLTNVASHLVRIRVQHPPTLRLQSQSLDLVRRIAGSDTDGMNTPLPASADPQVNLDYAAWQETFVLQFATQPRPREVSTTIATRMDIDELSVRMNSSVILQTRFAPLFAGEFLLPADWAVTKLERDGASIPWQVIAGEPGWNRIEVPFPQPLSPGNLLTFVIQAEYRGSETWPPQTEPAVLPLPELRVPESNVTEGTVFVVAHNDFELTTPQLTGLDAGKLPAGNFAPGPKLLFEYQDTRYSGQVRVVRKPGRLSAQSVAFHRIDRETVSAYFGLTLRFFGGRERTVQLATPESLGTDIRFTLLGGDSPLVEQSAAPAANGERLWTLRFADPVAGPLQLELKVSSPRPTGNQPIVFPTVRIPAAEQIDSYICVEAGADQQLALTTSQLSGQPIPEASLLAIPGVNYLPKERVIAAYRSREAGAVVQAVETRFDPISLPSAVCDQLQLLSYLHDNGERHNQADFRIRAVGVQSLQLVLPKESRLWSTLLDGQPVEVRRLPAENSSTGFLIPLYTDSAASQVVSADAVRSIRIVYSQTGEAMTGRGALSLQPPQLLVAGAGKIVPVNVLDRNWSVRHSHDLLIVNSDGEFEPQQPLDSQPTWWSEVLQAEIPDVNGLLYRGVGLLVGGFLIWAFLRLLTSGWRGAIGAMALLVIGMAGLFIGFTLSLGSKDAATANRAAGAIDRRFSVVLSEQDSPMAPAPPMGPGGLPAVQKSSMPESAMPRSADTLGDQVSKMDTSAPQDAPANGRDSEWEDLAKSEEFAKREMRRSGVETRGGAIESKSVDMDSANDGEKPKGEMARDGGRQARPQVRLEDGLNAAVDEKAEMAGVEQPPAGEPAAFPAPAPAAAKPAGNDRAAADDAPQAGGRPAGAFGRLKGALLSLALQVETPSDARETKFQYLGDTESGDVGSLSISYDKRQTIDSRTWATLFVVVFLCWLARRQSLATKALIAILGLLGPIAAWPVAPMTIQPILLAVFFGTCTSIALWIVAGIGCWIWGGPRSSVSTATILAAMTAGSMLFCGSNISAQETPPPPAIVRPFTPGGDPLASDRVFIETDKFLRLWNTAYPDRPLTPVAAPGDPVVSSGAYEVIVSGDAKKLSATASAVFTLETFRKSQTAVRLPLGRVAVSSAKLDGQTAPLGTIATDSGPELAVLVSSPGVHTLEIQFSVPVNGSLDAGKLSLPIRPTPAGAMRVTLPHEGVAWKLTGTTAPFRQQTGEGRSVVVAPVDSATDLTVGWSPAQAARAADANVQATSATAVAYSDLGLTVSAGFSLQVRQGAITEFAISVPMGFLLREVRGADVGGWELVDAEATRRVNVFLRRSVDSSTDVVIDLFRPLTLTETAAPSPVPDVAPLGVSRETGLIGLFAEPQLTLSPGTITAASQIDSGLFVSPQTLLRPEGAPRFAYRFTNRPLKIEMSVGRQPSQVQAVCDHGIALKPRKVLFDSQLELNLQGAPRSQVAIRLPPGYIVNDLSSESNIVADYYLPPAAVDESSTLIVEFTQPQRGRVVLLMQGAAARDPENLAPEIDVPSPTGINSLKSNAAIVVDGSYIASFGAQDGWRSVDPGSLANLRISGQNQIVPLAFSSSLSTPSPLVLSLTKGQARLTGDVLTTAVVGPASVDYIIGLQWRIEQSSESKFLFKGPSSLQDRLQVIADPSSGIRIRETKRQPLRDNTTLWTVVLDEPVRGGLFLLATATVSLPDAGPGQSAVVTIPQIELVASTAEGLNGLPRQQQYALLVNRSEAQLTPLAPDALETVRTEDIPIKVDAQLAVEAAELGRIRDAKNTPAWRRQPVQTLSSLPASVNLLDITQVVSRDGSYRCQAELRINNRNRQFLGLKLPEGARILAVAAGGMPVRPVITSRNGSNLLLIPLPKMAAGDLATQARVVFGGRLNMRLPNGLKVMRTEFDMPRVEVPSRTEDPDYGAPVARTSWTVYVPDDFDLAVVDDPNRTTVTESNDDYERLIAILNEAWQLSVIDSVSSYVSVEKFHGEQNRKTLTMEVEKALRGVQALGQSQAVINGNQLNVEQSKELNELYARIQQKEAEIRAKQTQLGVEVSTITSNSVTDSNLYNEQIQSSLFLGNSGNAGQVFSEADVASDNWGITLRRRQLSAERDKAGAEKKEADSKDAAAGKVAILDKLSRKQRSELKLQNVEQLQSLNSSLGFGNGQVVQADPQITGSIILDGSSVQNNNAWHMNRFGAANANGPNFGGGMGGAAGFLGGGGMAGGIGGLPQNRAGELALQQAVPAEGGAFGANDFAARIANLPASGQRPAAGLSLTIEIPKSGRKHSFSNVGGEARLAIGLLPRRGLQSGLGWIWTGAWIVLGLVAATAIRSGGIGRLVGQVIPAAAMFGGVAWCLLRPEFVPGAFLFAAGLTAFLLVRAWNRWQESV